MAAALTALSLLFFAAGVNGVDLGLPGFITGKRIGLILLTAAMVMVPLKRASIPRPARYAPWVLAAIGVWGLISLLISPGDFGLGLGLVTAWILTAYATLAFALIFSWIIPDQKRFFVTCMVVSGALVPMAAVALLFRHGGLDIFFQLIPLRMALDSLESGMSRFLNGLFFLSFLPFAAVLGTVRVPRWLYCLSLAGMGAFLALALTSGSRQTVGAIAAYLLTLFLIGTLLDRYSMMEKTITGKRKWLMTVFSLAAFTVVLRVIFQQEDLEANIHRRFIEKTDQQFNEGQIRLEISKIAWNTVADHPVFGVGPGVFPMLPENYTEYSPHNGYIGTMVEYGFPALAAFLALIASALITAWKKRNDAYVRGNGDIFKATLSFCVIFAIWTINFNDLAREYFFWASLTLMIVSRFKPDLQKPEGVNQCPTRFSA